ncbi:MAG: outer membrane lipoprotein-sorting protein [Nitrospinaceae bacterium]|nr:outer membrane lipoprotein-sorting protein [Nitrospinaceae bacterium]NIR56178.1 outer membrane lipoprotein-sorting protein [Nitrospinaceae bacterium]NIS86634.1 outer membrane lipoprotein-sorting protein [Nitrospinaceae bacterium]NIT83467.1 outer membrane lipoprotein-sorting protein [Nitrospinaceae bacterium]NIU45672.1 outer membrane lipoprotein-sorting protein [Nitrospinaceae bacterium]
MNKFILTCGLLALGWTAGAPECLYAKSPAAEEIVNRSNLAAYYQGKDGRSHVDMTITDAQGRTRKRRFIILRYDKADGADQKFYVHFSRPADVRNMVFMVWKHVDTSDDRWLYLPALDLVKRIAASDKRTSFVGSHFFYEDVSGRNPKDDTHELIDTTGKFFVLKNTPKNPGEVEFSSYTLWIDKTTYLPMKAEYLDKNGKKYRVVEALEVKTVQGHPTVTKARVSDLKSGGNTVSVFSKIKYDLGIPDRIFSERFLRRAPRRWLK